MYIVGAGSASSYMSGLPTSTWNSYSTAPFHPPGTKYAIFTYANSSAGAITVGIRKPGSGVTTTYSVPAGADGWFFVELDANRNVETYVSSTNDYVSGAAYFSDQQGVVLLGSPVDYTPASANTWTTQSISAQTGTDTAAFAIIRYNGTRHAVRHPSHTTWDVIRTTKTSPGFCDIVPLNGSEEFEYQTESTGTAITLLGYIKNTHAVVNGSATKQTFSSPLNVDTILTTSYGADSAVALLRFNGTSGLQFFNPVVGVVNDAGDFRLGAYGLAPILGDAGGRFEVYASGAFDYIEVGALYLPSPRKQVYWHSDDTPFPGSGTSQTIYLYAYRPYSVPVHLVVCVYLRNTNIASHGVTSVTDNFGNSYSLVASKTQLTTGSDGVKLLIYAASATQISASTQVQITVQFSPSQSSIYMGAFAVANFDPMSPISGVVTAGVDINDASDPSVTLSGTVPAGSQLFLMAGMWQSGFGNAWSTTGDLSVAALGGGNNAWGVFYRNVAIDETNPTLSIATGQTTNGWAAIGFYTKGTYIGQYTASGPSKATTSGLWLPSSGTSLPEMINEDTPDTNNYIYTDFKNTVSVFDLPKIVDPVSSSYHVVEIYASGTGDNPQVKVSLWQGTSFQVATWTQAVTSTPTLYRFTLTGAEADSITNYDDLDVKVESL